MIEKTLLSATAISKSFNGHNVLDRLSLMLREGEVVLLRGDNGSGKTTLLNILTGNLEPDSGKLSISANGEERSFSFPRSWWQKLNPFDHFSPEFLACRGVGRSWQDIRLFQTHNLLDNVAIATPGQHGENPFCVLLRSSIVSKEEAGIRRTATQILEEMGLAGRETSSADKISLGQSKRVAIARAVQAGAKILLLDEPLAGLDERGVTEVMSLLDRLVRDQKMTLVIVEHILNVPRILGLATTVWTLANGELTVNSASAAQAKLSNTSEGHFNLHLDGIAELHAEVIEHELPGGACFTTISPSDSNDAEIVLDVDDLVVHRGPRLVIGQRLPDDSIVGLSCVLRKGQLGFLHAPNGWGKTTFFEALCGLLPITRGSIRLLGKDIGALPPWERAMLGIAFLQARNHGFPSLKVEEALRLSGISDIPEPIRTLCGKHCSHLSGGEKQRLAFWSIVCGMPFILGMFDEPFTALDRSGAEMLIQAVRSRLKDSALLIAVPQTHSFQTVLPRHNHRAKMNFGGLGDRNEAAG